jgi:hypothetical protein
MAIIETLTAKLEAETADFQAGMSQATQQLQDFTATGATPATVATQKLDATATTTSGHGIGVLRRGLEALAFQASGVSGPIGHVTAGLVQLGGGTGVTLVAAAAIATLGLAFREMTQDTRDNEQALSDLATNLDTLGPHAQIVAAKVRLALLEAQRQDVSIPTQLGRAFKAIFGASFAEQEEQLQRQIAALTTQIGKAEKEFEQPWRKALDASTEAVREQTAAQLHMGDTTAVATEAVRRQHLEHDKIPPAIAAEIAANERLAASLETGTNAYRSSINALVEANIRMGTLGQTAAQVDEILRRRQLLNEGVDPAIAASTAAQERLAAERNRFAAKFRQIFGDLNDQLADLGASAGKELIHGLITGMQSLEDTLKSFVLSFIEATIWSVLGGILGKIIGNPFSAAAEVGAKTIASAGGIAPQLMAGPGGHATLDFSGIAPLTAFAVARDPEFQRVLREGIIVSHGQGFRG